MKKPKDDLKKKLVFGDLCPLTIWFVMRDNEPKIVIDRKECFDKISKCPIILPVPKTEEQCNFLNEKMNWLRTKDGYKVSNEYERDKWISEYPEVIK